MLGKSPCILYDSFRNTPTQVHEWAGEIHVVFSYSSNCDIGNREIGLLQKCMIIKIILTICTYHI